MDQQTWAEALLSLFPKGKTLPERRVWTFYDDIVFSLRSLVSRTPCEIFWADTGGSLLTEVIEAGEQSCIKLIAGSACIVKPTRLEFESFGTDSLDWAYLRLEASRLSPILHMTTPDPDIEGDLSEFLAEAYPGQYYHPSVIDSRILDFDENGKPIATPHDTRIVKRYLSGTFVIFSASSPYKLLDEYRGVHIGLSRDELRDLIQLVLRRLT